MSKRGQLVQTYGRHRHRVVNIDVWTPTGINVFGSSDDNASLLDSLSPSVTGVGAHLRRKGVGKENAEEEGGSCRARRNQAGSRTDAIWKQKALHQYNSPLRDVSNVSAHASPAVTRRRKKLSLAASNSCELSSRIDFSDIEKHSLILSDSIEASGVGVGWRNKSQVTTSTPHLAQCSLHQIHTVAPSVDSERYSTSPLSLCRGDLENLHMADVSNITRTSSVGSYHDDSAMSRLHCLAEDCEVSVSYDASRDLFDDAPPRHRYLLRSMQKGATRASVVNDSMGGSFYIPTVNSTANYASEEASDESTDEAEVLSDVETEASCDEDSLSDISEEEESTASMASHRMMSLSTETSQTSSLATLHRSMKEALTPCKSGCRPLTPRERVLAQCSQTDICRFTDCITPVMMKSCTKIGEGVYGEVFRAQRGWRPVALKVIPIEGDFEVNDEPQKTFEEMLPEIVISKELSALRDKDVNRTHNFVHVLGVHIVEGCYPDTLLAQWDLFHRRKGSENDRPDMYKDTQLFLVFEFADSGADLEAFQLSNLDEARSVLEQVTRALAIAESELQFEHRDLHWGNVLVRRTDEPTISCCLNGDTQEIRSAGVEVAIIDFTLSRLCQDGCQVFTDLSKDPTLFTGHGDYQFDIYRLMKEVNSNDWEPHHPFTNVLWISYLADKLIRKQYLDASKNRSEHRALTRRFRTFIHHVLDYSSAVEMLCRDELFQ